MVADIGAAVGNVVSDLDLVHRLQTKDDLKAYELLLRRYEKEAFGLAYVLVGDREEARDVLQESFLNLYRSIKAFRGESSFRTYFFRILVNRCRDVQRKKSIWGRIFLWKASGEGDDLPEAVTEKTPLQEIFQAELGKKIGALMKELPWRQRTIFALKFIEGLKIREIAELTHLSPGTVKVHLFRAVSKMRTALREYAGTA